MDIKEQWQNKLAINQTLLGEKKLLVTKDNLANQEQIDALYEESSRMVSEIRKIQGSADYEGGTLDSPVRGKISSEFSLNRERPITKK